MTRSTQVLMDLPNGVTVSIITDGYGSEGGLYEAMVWRTGGGHQDALGDLIPGGDGNGIYGWLSEHRLGELMTAAVALQAR